MCAADLIVGHTVLHPERARLKGPVVLQFAGGNMDERHPLCVLVSDSDPDSASDTCRRLADLGHWVAGVATDVPTTLRLARRLRPDLILWDPDMAGAAGLRALGPIDEERICPIILTSAAELPGSSLPANQPTLQAFLTKPVTADKLAPAIELAVRGFWDYQRLEQKKQELAGILRSRELLTLACHALCERFDCSYAEAWERMQHEARAKRKGLDEIAQAILEETQANHSCSAPI